MRIEIPDLASDGQWVFEGTPREVWRKAYRLARRWIRCGFADGLSIGGFTYRLSIMVWTDSPGGGGWQMRPLIRRPRGWWAA